MLLVFLAETRTYPTLLLSISLSPSASAVGTTHVQPPMPGAKTSRPGHHRSSGLSGNSPERLRSPIRPMEGRGTAQIVAEPARAELPETSFLVDDLIEGAPKVPG
jgi:hypothetical protein